MSTVLSDRVTQIKPSATMAVNAKANELRAQGRDIINLSVGEPDFPSPDFVKAAAIDAINENFTRYTAVDGIPELKDAIIGKLSRDNQLDYKRNEIIVSVGVKQGLFNLTQAMLNAGDEAIIPAPYWVSYPAMTKLAGATPVVIDTKLDANFKITAAQLEAAITPKTRLLFLNSPSNPTGMAYTESELRAIGDVLQKHPHIIVASDDIYEYILWGMDRYVSILNVCPELRDQVVVFNGVSKAHCMTGWRIGYAAGPANIVAAMKKIQGQSTSNPCSVSQKAAIAAINTPKADFFTPMLDAFKRRHDMVLDKLQAIEGVECRPSHGTFYLFPNVSHAMQRLGLENDVALAEVLLEKAGVALVPGSAFGSPGCIRISCATDDATLANAIDQIANVLAG